MKRLLTFFFALLHDMAIITGTVGLIVLTIYLAAKHSIVIIGIISILAVLAVIGLLYLWISDTWRRSK